MTGKVYRTAQGKKLDLGALALKNENVRAVGNMNVNARGDLLDADNRSIASRNQQVARQYKRQTTNVTDDRVRSSADHAPPRVPQIDPELLEDFDDTAPLPETATAPEDNKTTKGIAAAVARARKI